MQVRGNHDDAALAACVRRRELLHELSKFELGGREQTVSEREAAVCQGQADFVESAERRREHAEEQGLRRALEEECAGYEWTDELADEEILYLDNMPYTLQLPEDVFPHKGRPVVLVHAGFLPGVSRMEQKWHDMYMMRYVREGVCTSEDKKRTAVTVGVEKTGTEDIVCSDQKVCVGACAVGNRNGTGEGVHDEKKGTVEVGNGDEECDAFTLRTVKDADGEIQKASGVCNSGEDRNRLSDGMKTGNAENVTGRAGKCIHGLRSYKDLLLCSSTDEGATLWGDLWEGPEVVLFGHDCPRNLQVDSAFVCLSLLVCTESYVATTSEGSCALRAA